MSNEIKSNVDVEASQQSVLGGALRHVRAATLAASLVPVALITAVPLTVVAEEPCGGSGEPDCPTVPEPSVLMMLAGPAAALLLRRRRK
jgi:hypothetical protein